jgi:membrane associated rhomboid family serine protease
MYIVCLSQGIDTTKYMVLAPWPQTLRDFGAFNYQLLKDGEVWRLITAAFLH